MRQRKGFTLTELLIVVAIIAVLTAIGIPLFTKQLEKSRESTDAANIRSAYGNVMSYASGSDESKYWDGSAGKWISEEIELKQKKTDWQNASIDSSLNGLGTQDGTPEAGSYAVVECEINEETGKAEIVIRYGEGSEPGGPEIDYSSSQSVGKYVFSEVSKLLKQYQEGTLTDEDYTKVFRQTNSWIETKMTLPNGSEVTVKVYNRDYDRFQSTPERMAKNTASLIYNRSTGSLSTIIYHDGTNYSSWSSNGNYSGWEADQEWNDNEYIK